MGEKDLNNLFKIYNEIRLLKKEYNLPLNFKIDKGSFETAIEFIDDKPYHPPKSKDWSTNPIILCPDLLDYQNRLIIEYEEEVGNRRTGAKQAKKGHNREGDIPNKRDARRNDYYQKGKFSYFQIWESDEKWKIKLKNFVISKFGNSKNMKLN